jgi:hypothetical protein
MGGLEEWRNNLKKVWAGTSGIVRVVGIALYCLTLLSLSEWIVICLWRRDTARSTFIDAYVVLALILSVAIFALGPSFWLAVLSSYLSGSTVLVLLKIVLLSAVLGNIGSPERSLLLFICNVTQIVYMFATWYDFGGQKDPLLTSVLTFATIAHAVDMPKLAMIQIATDFVLLAIFLSHLIGRVGLRGTESPEKPSSRKRLETLTELCDDSAGDTGQVP